MQLVDLKSSTRKKLKYYPYGNLIKNGLFCLPTQKLKR